MDPFVLLRNQLLSDDPSLVKYVAAKRISCKTEIPVNDRRNDSKRRDHFKIVDPKTIDNENEVYEKNGKKFKKVRYGTTNGFLIHRGLNPTNLYTSTICRKELNDLKGKRELTLEAREIKNKELTIQKASLAEESEKRRDFLKNTTINKTAFGDDLVKQDKAKTKLILSNAKKSLADRDEEMRQFYSHSGSTQILAMRELQIDDNKRLASFDDDKMTTNLQRSNETTEYEEMVARKKEERERNMKIVDVLKKQASEKEILRNLEIERNFEIAEKIDVLAEAELKKRLIDKEIEEKEKQNHFEVFNKIASYRDRLRQIRLAEDEALANREEDYLIEKKKFDRIYSDKRDEIREQRRRMISLVSGDLKAEMEKKEIEEMEYYYTVEKEKEIREENNEIREKIEKKEAMRELMSAWDRIREENKQLKELEKRQEDEEKVRQLTFLEMENSAKKAEERKKLVEKDVNRMEIMYQINEREIERQKAAEASAREATLLRAEQFVRDGQIKERMLEKMTDFRNNGLPDRFLNTIRNRYNL